MFVRGQARLPSVKLTVPKSITRRLYVPGAQAAQLLGSWPNPKNMTFVAADLEEHTVTVSKNHKWRHCRFLFGHRPRAFCE